MSTCLLLRVHSLQHFGVGAASGTVHNLKVIKRQTVQVISSKTPALFIRVTKFTLTIPVTYIINKFRGKTMLV